MYREAHSMLGLNINMGPTPDWHKHGYRTLLWDNAAIGQTVWLRGTVRDGRKYAPKLYGPFTVESVRDRRLINAKGHSMLHYPEDLLCKQS